MFRYLLALCWCCLFCSATQAQTVQFSIAQWQLDELVAEDLQFEFELTTDGLTAHAKAEKVVLPAPINEIVDVSLDCHQVELGQGQLSCQQGIIRFYQHAIGTQNLKFKLTANYDDEYYLLALQNIVVADSRFAVNARVKRDQWQASVRSQTSSLSSLVNFAQSYLSKELQAKLTAWQFDDKSALKLDLTGQADVITTAKLDIKTKQLELYDEAGLYAAETISSKLSVKLQRANDNWHWQSSLLLSDGQAYADPVFFDFAQHTLSIDSEGYWQNNADKLIVNKLEFDHQNIVKGQAQLSLADSEIKTLELRLDETAASQLYQHWLQAFTVGTAVDSLRLTGRVAVNYRLQDGDYQFGLTAKDLTATDQLGRFAIQDLNGQLGWTTLEQPVLSKISWQSADLYAVSIGQSIVKASVSGSQLQLTEPWNIPVFDGQLQINSQALGHDESTHWAFDGLVTPVSMSHLSEALGWPTLHGKLSGVIPKVSYQDQKIAIDGALMVKLFEGTTIIRDLRLERPFGTIPQLYGNIDLLGLDLETLTKTFEFGKITGKLDGKVNNLRLSNWQPVHFDAHFATPVGDKSKRRISQQAIDNISQLGGGATGVISKSFLRFFEDFSYQKMGLSCKLRNEVCTISGVEESESAYYIVKGGGLPPRINVMGYTRRVDWPELIARLKAVSSSAGPVVK